MWQGHVEAYGSYEEIQARGVELMDFISTQNGDQERRSFQEAEWEHYEEEIGSATEKEWDHNNDCIVIAAV